LQGEVKPYNVWGKPVKFIEASYINTNGETRRSALLAGGYWGLARHANYTCELLVSFLWCLPSAAGHIKFIPLLYFYFIAGLIAHRILRDEDKCSTKYGKYWQKYCHAVPYRFIPYIF
jgi:7-dehydrocholesterol reductase